MIHTINVEKNKEKKAETVSLIYTNLYFRLFLKLMLVLLLWLFSFFFFPTFYSPGSLLLNHQNYIVTVSKKPSLTFSFLRLGWMIPIFVLTNPWAYLCHLPALYWHHLLRISYSCSIDCMIILGRRCYTSFPPG